jgi:hypothetical protein
MNQPARMTWNTVSQLSAAPTASSGRRYSMERVKGPELRVVNERHAA